MVVANITKEKIICTQLRLADTFFTRLKGLLGQKEIEEDTGLLIKPCQSVHTIGMGFAIDVIFIGEDNRVVGIIEEMQPYRLSRFYSRAKKVLELKAGMVQKTELQIGDLLSFKNK